MWRRDSVPQVPRLPLPLLRFFAVLSLSLSLSISISISIGMNISILYTRKRGRWLKLPAFPLAPLLIMYLLLPP